MQMRLMDYLNLKFEERFSDVEAIVEFFIIMIKPEKIFHIRQVENEAADLIDFIIVVNDGSGIPINQLEPVAEFVASFNKSVSCSLVSAGLLNRYLKDGRLFYVHNCTPDNLIYNLKGNELPKPDPEKIKKEHRRASSIFSSSLSLSKHFYKGALFYNVIGENRMSAFMAQQSIEHCLRGLILGFYGRDQRTHSIRNLKTHVKRIAPHLNLLIPEETEFDRQLADLLEDVYIESRYSVTFNFGNEHLRVLLKRTLLLQKESELFFDRVMKPLVAANHL